MPRLSFRQQQLVIGVGIVLLILGGLGVWLLVKQSSNDTGPVSAEVITESTKTPDETVPGNSFAWRGGKTDPKNITIESIGVNAYLQNVGVDQDGLMAVPNNIHIGGWFVNSVRPGDKGLSIIDGHVDGVTSNAAIFSLLGDVKVGDIVSITSGDNEVRRFEVVSTTQTTIEKTPELLYSQDPTIERQLTLVTCTGTYSRDQATYDQRLIVVTKRI